MAQAMTSKMTPDYLAQRRNGALTLLPEFAGDIIHQRRPSVIPAGALQQGGDVLVALENLPQQTALNILMILWKQVLRRALLTGANQGLRRHLCADKRHIQAAHGKAGINTGTQGVANQQPAFASILYGHAMQPAFRHEVRAVLQRFTSAQQRAQGRV